MLKKEKKFLNDLNEALKNHSHVKKSRTGFNDIELVKIYEEFLFAILEKH